MPKVTDAPCQSQVEDTAPYVSTPAKKLHHAVNRALDHYLKPPADEEAAQPTPTPGAIFVVAPDINNETLLAYAYESLASANVLANDFSAALEGTQRNTMLALQQIIMLGELAVSRVLDNIGRSPRI